MTFTFTEVKVPPIRDGSSLNSLGAKRRAIPESVTPWKRARTSPASNRSTWSGAAVVEIDSRWERATVTDPVVSTKRFGRVRVTALLKFTDVGESAINKRGNRALCQIDAARV
jgi:hypothetical protein